MGTCRDCVLWDGLHLYNLALRTYFLFPRKSVSLVGSRLCETPNHDKEKALIYFIGPTDCQITGCSLFGL
jgi:hypothetical protein